MTDATADHFADLLGQGRGTAETEAERELRDLAVVTTPAVIASCQLCDERSAPIDPQQVNDWARRHAAKHEVELLRRRWTERGHYVRAVVEWVDQDDSKGHAECDCGWRSRSAKVCWIDDYAIRHLRELDSAEN